MAVIKFRLPFELTNRLIVDEYLKADVPDDFPLDIWMAQRLGAVLVTPGGGWVAHIPEERAVEFKLTWL